MLSIPFTHSSEADFVLSLIVITGSSITTKELEWERRHLVSCLAHACTHGRDMPGEGETPLQVTAT